MTPMAPMKPMAPMAIEKWWPQGLGEPATLGSQDDMRYAFFPEKRLLLIEVNGKLKTFDSGLHCIRGVSQASEARSLAFTSQHGPVRIEDLRRLR